MSNYEQDRYTSAASAGSADAGAGRAPGKRTLTQFLPPRQSSLRDQQRAVVDFDAGVDGETGGMSDTRSTIESKVDNGPDLSNRQIARAKRKNPRWIAKLKVSAQILSNAPVGSAEFAFDVAAKQAARGLVVDGIAGPKTVTAITGEVTAARSSGGQAQAAASSMEPREVVDMDDAVGDDFYDERATVDPMLNKGAMTPFSADDPFGMHLIGAA